MEIGLLFSGFFKNGFSSIMHGRRRGQNFQTPGLWHLVKVLQNAPALSKECKHQHTVIGSRI